MAEKTVVISQQSSKPIKISKWKVSEGCSVSIGSVILLYDFEGVGKIEQRKVKSTQAGTVYKIIGKEGAIIKPGEPLLELEACIHPTVFREMCAECGADLRKDDLNSTASVPVVHSVPELKVSEELAKKLGKVERERLIKDRKLVLLVDLDQTLIHTTNDIIPPNWKDVYHFQLYGPNSPWYHTRLRPGTHQFLINVSPYFELHICTFGARNYAHKITTILDSDGCLFSNRILSREECFNPTSKTANLKALFPCGDHMVCIIDDREDVWSHVSNLIHVKPYHFFQHTGDINAPPGLDKHENDEKEGIDPSKVKIKPKGKEKTIENEVISVTEKTSDIELKNNNTDEKNMVDKEGLECDEQNISETETKMEIEISENERTDKEVVNNKEEVNKKEQSSESEQENTNQIVKVENNLNKNGANSDKTETVNSDKTETVNNDKIETVNNDEIETVNKEEHVSDTNHLEQTLLKSVSTEPLVTVNGQSDNNGEIQTEKKNCDKVNLNNEKDKVPTATAESTEKTKQEIEEELQKTKSLNSLLELIEIDDPDDYLLYLEDILKRIHKAFYEEFDKMENGEVPDLKIVMPVIKSQVLKGTKLVFSGLVPTHIKLQQSKAYQIAKNLGAEVTQDIEEDTTHLIAMRPGTAKVNIGRRKKNLKIVSSDWLWECAERWEHVHEKLFPLNSKGSKNRRPPPHCSSPQPLPEYATHDTPAARKRTPSGRFMDTINPLMSFSSADIADMDKEVEDILDAESESESEEEEEESISKTKSLSDVLNKDKDDSSSSSCESLTAELPRGYKRTREKRDEDQLDEDLKEDSEDEFPSTKFRRGEELDSDLDIGQNSNSEGSVDAPDEIDDGEWNMMGAALEREFLSNN